MTMIDDVYPTYLPKVLEELFGNKADCNLDVKLCVRLYNSVDDIRNRNPIQSEVSESIIQDSLKRAKKRVNSEPQQPQLQSVHSAQDGQPKIERVFGPRRICTHVNNTYLVKFDSKIGQDQRYS